MRNIHAVGLGGQGILTFSKLIAEYAQKEGLKAGLFHSKGMAQRGGRVTSDIRISSVPDAEFSPRIAEEESDFIVGLEIGETLNSLPMLKKGGTVIVHHYAAVPTSVVLDKKKNYPSPEEVLALFRKKTDRVYGIEKIESRANIFLLGLFTVLASFDRERMMMTIETMLKRGQEENRKAFEEGYRYGSELTR